MVLLFQRNENLIQLKQLHSTKPELRFCAVLNTTRGVSVIRDGEDLWQWPRLEIRLNAFRRSTIPQKQLIIIIIIIIISTTRPNLPPIAFKLVSNKLMALILPLSKYDGWTYPLLTWSYGVLSKSCNLCVMTSSVGWTEWHLLIFLLFSLLITVLADMGVFFLNVPCYGK